MLIENTNAPNTVEYCEFVKLVNVVGFRRKVTTLLMNEIYWTCFCEIHPTCFLPKLFPV